MPEEKSDKKEKTNVKEHKTPAVKKKPGGLLRLARAVRREKQPRPKAEEKLLELDRSPYDILKFVLMTEKSVRQIELQNKLVFIVDRGAAKSEIKAAANAAFNSPISEVRTLIDQAGRKKAFIKFSQAGAAGDIAIRLGII